jgi:hypothetical protein
MNYPVLVQLYEVAPTTRWRASEQYSLEWLPDCSIQNWSEAKVTN